MSHNDTADGDSCCRPPTQAESAQRLATDLVHKALAIIDSKVDVDQALVLIEAGHVLLDRNGGRNNSPGVWLLSVLSELAEAKGYPVHALAHLRQSKELAEKVFGPDHPDTLVCQANYASTMCKMGLFQGTSLLKSAIQRLEQASPPDEYNQEFISRALADCRRIYGETIKWQTPEEALAQFKKVYIRPGFTTGIMDAMLRDPNTVDVWYRSFTDFERIPDEHKVKFKGLNLVWGKHIPEGVVIG